MTSHRILDIVQIGNEVVISRADGEGDEVRLTVEEWRAWLAATRLVDLDPDNLPREQA